MFDDVGNPLQLAPTFASIAFSRNGQVSNRKIYSNDLDITDFADDFWFFG